MTIPEFQIGFAISGLTLASAYSAGVIDFFMQALDAWERAKNKEKNAGMIPRHRVGIKVFSGASAGAITAAAGVVGCAGGLRPRKIDNPKPRTQDTLYVLPSLYETIVDHPSWVAGKNSRDLLQTSNSARGNLPSILGPKTFDDITAAALNLQHGRSEPLPYLSSSLHIYIMVTNLRGVPYSVQFDGGRCQTLSHCDRFHYCISGIGSWQTSSKFADCDQAIKLEVGALFNNQYPFTTWQDFGKSALASIAFPFVLSPWMATTTLSEYDGRQWPFNGLGAGYEPTWPQPWGTDKDRRFQFFAVDGSLTGNEPLEYARYALLKDLRWPWRNPREGDKADRAVVMIDPFPQNTNLRAGGNPEDELTSIITALVSVAKHQSRCKPPDLTLAGNEKVFSRFMVLPRRTTPEGREERYALASGIVGGFGGFLAREFRDHDFQLGRRNCQKFLRTCFMLPESNQIVSSWPDGAKEQPQFQHIVGNERYFSIVPLLGDADPEVPFPEWPQVDFEMLAQRLERRIIRIIDRLIDTKTTNRWFRLILNMLCSAGVRSRLLKSVYLMLLQEFVCHGQIKGWQIPKSWKRPLSTPIDDNDIRLVWSELINPSFDLRSEAGLAASTGLDINKVQAILATSQAETGSRFEVWRSPLRDRSGAPLYTLRSRKPMWCRFTVGVQHLCDWIAPLKVDAPGL